MLHEFLIAGLPPGKANELFRPFEMRGADQSALGLGLACVFTVDLPRLPAAS